MSCLALFPMKWYSISSCPTQRKAMCFAFQVFFWIFKKNSQPQKTRESNSSLKSQPNDDIMLFHCYYSANIGTFKCENVIMNTTLNFNNQIRIIRMYATSVQTQELTEIKEVEKWAATPQNSYSCSFLLTKIQLTLVPGKDNY